MGGGTSPGGATTSFWTGGTHSISKETFEQGYTKEDMTVKSRIRVTLNEEYHYIGVVEMTQTTAKINVSSDPMQVVLEVGQDAKFDVLNDGFYDVYVKLNSILNNKANVTIQEIHEEIPEEEGVISTEGEVTGSVPSGEEEDLEEEKVRWWAVLIICIVVIGVVAGSYFLLRKKKN